MLNIINIASTHFILFTTFWANRHEFANFVMDTHRTAYINVMLYAINCVYSCSIKRVLILMKSKMDTLLKHDKLLNKIIGIV